LFTLLRLRKNNPQITQIFTDYFLIDRNRPNSTESDLGQFQSILVCQEIKFNKGIFVMITMFNAFTNEIDDPSVAVKEITEQLKNKKLLKNTIGIIGCHCEYVENGTINSLSKILPFELIGCVVLGSAVNGNSGFEQLSLTVLTSNDITFTAAISKPIVPRNFDSSLEKVYADVTKSGTDPSFIADAIN
jgi:D-alanine-D-alanine ligase-like ATP-grasp enzyme